MRSVHFGAGNIGRGFIGQLLHEAGYDITFADVQHDLVDALRTQGRYEVILADEAEERIAVDLITTAVGPSVLPILAPAIAEGLEERTRRGGAPVNVIACENLIGGSQALRASVMEHVPDERAIDEVAGFPNAAVDRIVPEQTTGGIDVLVEPFFEWIVDASQANGERPDVPGITYVEDLGPFIERKLLTVTRGHSAAAYLGYARGENTIDAALEDDRVYEVASKSLEETGLLLVREHRFDPE